MGKHSSKLAPEMLDDLVRSTEFSEQELKQWYKGFLKDCPTGILNLEEFQQLYIKVGSGQGPECCLRGWSSLLLLGQGCCFGCSLCIKLTPPPFQSLSSLLPAVLPLRRCLQVCPACFPHFRQEW